MTERKNVKEWDVLLMGKAVEDEDDDVDDMDEDTDSDDGIEPDEGDASDW